MKKNVSIKKVVGNVLIALVILLLLLTVAVTVINKKENKPTFVFGYALLWVKTGSMEPTVPVKSYILVKAYDKSGVKEGDIVTFICNDPTSPVYNGMITHRIFSVTDEGYRTKGDNSAPDKFIVKDDEIVATYVKNLSVLTFFGRVFSSPVGLMLIVALFVGSTAFLYIPDIINALKDEDKQKEQKELEIQKRIEEEIEKLRRNDALPNSADDTKKDDKTDGDR